MWRRRVYKAMYSCSALVFCCVVVRAPGGNTINIEGEFLSSPTIRCSIPCRGLPPSAARHVSIQMSSLLAELQSMHCQHVANALKNAPRFRMVCPRTSITCVTRRRQNKPSNTQEPKQQATQHRTTTRSSANLTKPKQTPTQCTLLKDTIILHTAQPQAASSQRT